MPSSALARIFLPLALICLASLPAAAQQRLEATTMAVPAYSLSFSMGYLAQDMGFFAKHGLSVKALEIQGLGAINAVISGSSAFAEPSGASLTRAAAHGQRLLAIAELLDRPNVLIVLRKDVAASIGFDPKAPLAKRAAALRGRTIAVDSINSVVHGYLRLIARRGGLDPEAIRVAPMAPQSMIAAVAAKEIDGIAMSPPWPQMLILDGGAVLVASGPDGDPSDLAPIANTVLAARPETCQRDETLCKGMGGAFADAASFIRNHPEAAIAALKKRFPTLGDPLLAAAFAVIRKITPTPPVVDRIGLENSELFNIDAGLMKPAEKLQSYDGLFTDRYVR